MLELVALAGAAAGGTYAYLVARRGRAHARWRVMLDEVAKKLGGRASPGSMFDAPELRATIDGVTVTLELRDIHKPAKGVAVAEAKLEGADEKTRVYLGWDVAAVPQGLEHFPEVDHSGAGFVDGKVLVRGSDAAVARRFVDAAAIDLIDLRRESGSRAIEVICRGGYLDLRAHGMTESVHMIERLMTVSARLARAFTTAATPVTDDADPNAACALCTDVKKAKERWLRCARCRAPYHHTCWTQAGGCVVPSCEETNARPFETV